MQIAVGVQKFLLSVCDYRGLFITFALWAGMLCRAVVKGPLSRGRRRKGIVVEKGPSSKGPLPKGAVVEKICRQKELLSKGTVEREPLRTRATGGEG